MIRSLVILMVGLPILIYATRALRRLWGLRKDEVSPPPWWPYAPGLYLLGARGVAPVIAGCWFAIAWKFAAGFSSGTAHVIADVFQGAMAWTMLLWLWVVITGRPTRMVPPALRR